MSPDDQARRLGAMLKCAEVGDEFEYRFMFDLTANTFLQKLIPKNVMDRKLNLAPGEFFRSLLVLSFAATVFDSGKKLLDNVEVISKELLKLNRKATLPLGLIVTEIALHAAEHDVLDQERECRKRFERLDNRRCACDAAAIDPYYEAVGFMLGEQLAMKDGAARAGSKGQYQAAVFADAFMPQMKKGADGVAARLLKGDYWEASIQALRSCSKTATLEDLESYFQG